MRIYRLKQAIRLPLYSLFLFFILLPSAAAAAGDDGDDGTAEAATRIAFVDARESATFGPPLPAEIEIVLSVAPPTAADTTTAETLTLTFLNFVTENGRFIPPATLIHGYPAAGFVQSVPGKAVTQFVTFTVPLNCCTDVAWGTYTGMMVAQLGDGAPVTQPLTLTAGPQQQPVILSPKLVITAVGCPDIVGDSLFLGALLCPANRTSAGFKVKIQQDGHVIRMEGFDPHYIMTAGGAAVSEEGAGRIRLTFDETQCKNCLEHDLRIGGSTKSGKYVGQFYLDATKTPGENDALDVIVLVRDYWLLPLLTLIVGVAVSAGITRYFNILLPGESAKKKEQKLKDDIETERQALSAALNDFVAPDKPYQQDGFYTFDPDIVYEVQQLVQKEAKVEDGRLSELKQMSGRFRRYRDFFLRLYTAYSGYKKLQRQAANWNDVCQAKMAEMGVGLAAAKKRLWTADTDLAIERAQDKMITVLLGIDDLVEMACMAQVAVWEVPPALAVAEQAALSTAPDSAEIKPYNWRGLLWNIARWSIVILSGFYVVYLSNATFGTAANYVWAFLWGTTTEAVIKALASIQGSEKSILSVFAGLTK